MAYVSHPHAADHSSVWSKISAFFAMVGRALIVSSAMQARLEQVEKLNAKSDAELAAMNLRREDITAFVFRDLMYA